MSSEPTRRGADRAAVLAELTAVLAGVVHADAGRVDAEQPFAVLGLDSLLTVEFVAAVTRHFGVPLTGAALYEYPTPALLAGHLAAAGQGERAAAAGPGPAAAAAVLQDLREQLAGILHCDAWEIDAGAAFTELGLDSLLAAHFVAGVNRAYGLSERPVTVTEHPSLAAMASYLASRTPGPDAATDPDPGPGPGAEAGAGRRPAPAPTGSGMADPAPAPAAVAEGPGPEAPYPAAGPGGPLSRQEMIALLDAVRGERIGVDEAAALLTDRPAR
ncbi:phosphopantetheine-binding protein [Streptomyces sp. NPDC101225]|uniref:phosphopantetheine-binding protein n=1 Tax=Streptomyces sp. NPDC101225 TaxID=3366135 RepID=UPI003828665B